MKTHAFYVAPTLEFPLSVRATFERELQIFTPKFTPLSISGDIIAVAKALQSPFGNPEQLE